MIKQGICKGGVNNIIGVFSPKISNLAGEGWVEVVVHAKFTNDGPVTFQADNTPAYPVVKESGSDYVALSAGDINNNNHTLNLIFDNSKMCWVLKNPWGATSGGSSSGGSTGVSDYAQLSNRPSINGVTLDGNKTASDLKLATQEAVVANQNGLTNANAKITALENTTNTNASAINQLKTDVATVSTLATSNEQRIVPLEQTASDVEANEGMILSLQEQIKVLESKISGLSKTNVVEVVVDSTTSLNQPDADLVIAGTETPISSNTTITANTVDVQKLDVDSSTVNVKTTGDVSISGYVSSGAMDGTTNHAQLNVYSASHVKVSDCTFGQSGYNGIQFGVGDAEVKSVVIDNCVFTGEMTNNVINVYANADNAVVTISNCKFLAKASNCLRFGNATNKRLTINVINCQFDYWEMGAPYQGCFCLQDHVCTSDEDGAARNVFGPDKVTINMVNCTDPNGNKIVKDMAAPATWLASGTDEQLAYIYTKQIVPYSADRYPTFTFK